MDYPPACNTAKEHLRGPKKEYIQSLRSFEGDMGSTGEQTPRDSETSKSVSGSASDTESMFGDIDCSGSIKSISSPWTPCSWGNLMSPKSPGMLMQQMNKSEQQINEMPPTPTSQSSHGYHGKEHCFQEHNQVTIAQTQPVVSSQSATINSSTINSSTIGAPLNRHGVRNFMPLPHHDSMKMSRPQDNVSVDGKQQHLFYPFGKSPVVTHAGEPSTPYTHLLSGKHVHSNAVRLTHEQHSNIHISRQHPPGLVAQPSYLQSSPSHVDLSPPIRDKSSPVGYGNHFLGARDVKPETCQPTQLNPVAANRPPASAYRDRHLSVDDSDSGYGDSPQNLLRHIIPQEGSRQGHHNPEAARAGLMRNIHRPYIGTSTASESTLSREEEDRRLPQSHNRGDGHVFDSNKFSQTENISQSGKNNHAYSNPGSRPSSQVSDIGSENRRLSSQGDSSNSGCGGGEFERTLQRNELVGNSELRGSGQGIVLENVSNQEEMASVVDALIVQVKEEITEHDDLYDPTQASQLEEAGKLGGNRLDEKGEIEREELCQVCGDISAGFHCGAFVCEACKKFYVRCVKSELIKFTCPRQKTCVVARETRTQCQYCRYQKCLQLGMYKPGGTNISSQIAHIPCRVCGAPSSGYHFGAITCEGCKGFFRRTIKERDTQKYQCSRGGECEITTATRNVCKFCRYKKCITVGMKSDGSRIGRQPNAVKHITMLQLQEIKMAKGLPSDFDVKPQPILIKCKEQPPEEEDLQEVENEVTSKMETTDMTQHNISKMAASSNTRSDRPPFYSPVNVSLEDNRNQMATIPEISRYDKSMMLATEKEVKKGSGQFHSAFESPTKEPPMLDSFRSSIHNINPRHGIPPLRKISHAEFDSRDRYSSSSSNSNILSPVKAQNSNINEMDHVHSHSSEHLKGLQQVSNDVFSSCIANVAGTEPYVSGENVVRARNDYTRKYSDPNHSSSQSNERLIQRNINRLHSKGGESFDTRARNVLQHHHSQNNSSNSSLSSMPYFHNSNNPNTPVIPVNSSVPREREDVSKMMDWDSTENSDLKDRDIKRMRESKPLHLHNEQETIGSFSREANELNQRLMQIHRLQSSNEFLRQMPLDLKYRGGEAERRDIRQMDLNHSVTHNQAKVLDDTLQVQKQKMPLPHTPTHAEKGPPSSENHANKKTTSNSLKDKNKFDMADFRPEKVIEIIQRAYKELAPILKRCPDIPCNIVQGAPLSEIWDIQMKQFAQCAHSTLKFSKKIPGFRLLPIQEQIARIQESMYPIVVAMLSTDYDLPRRQYNYFNLNREEEEVILNLFSDFRPLVNSFHILGYSTRTINLDNTELAFLCAFKVMAAVKESKYEDILIDALEHYILEKGEEVCRVGEVLLRLTEMAKINILHTECIIKTADLLKREGLEIPQLFHESFLND